MSGGGPGGATSEEASQLRAAADGLAIVAGGEVSPARRRAALRFAMECLAEQLEIDPCEEAVGEHPDLGPRAEALRRRALGLLERVQVAGRGLAVGVHTGAQLRDLARLASDLDAAQRALLSFGECEDIGGSD